MRKVAFVAPALLAACAPAELPVHGETAGHSCRVGAASQFVGQRTSAELGAAILRITNAAVLRWAWPGVMLTMDYRQDRVTVRIGSDGQITAISCG